MNMQKTLLILSLAARATLAQPPAAPPAATPAQMPPEAARLLQQRAGQLVELPDEEAPAMKMAPAPPCPGKADLRVTNVQATPLVIGWNVNQVNAFVRNFGTVAAGVFGVDARVCPAMGTCTGIFPYFIGYGSMNGTLAPGQGVWVQLNQAGGIIQLKPGPHKLHVRADMMNQVNECNEGNNVAIRNVQLLPTGPTPNFIVTGSGPVPLIMTATPGQALTISFSVMNAGSPWTAAPNNMARLMLVDVNNAGNQYTIWQAPLTMSLQSGQQEHNTLKPVTIPSNIPKGKYYWRGVADANNSVAETHEGDNIMQNGSTITII